MLALVLTLILGLYILGPDLFSRVIVSQFAPARARSKNRSEEIAQAIFLSSLPVMFVAVIAHYAFGHFANGKVLTDFLQGLYGEKSLQDHSDAFLAASRAIFWVNLKFLLLPVYGLVLVWSLCLGCLIKNYGRLLRRYDHEPWKAAVLTWLVRPWVAEWHLKLSRALLPKKTDYIRVDVLTKIDNLYRGTLAEHQLAPDGSLVSITLIDPRKFKRQELLEARAAGGNPKAKLDPFKYWSPIEAESFIVMASEIVTLNLNYVDPTSLRTTPKRGGAGVGRALAAAAKAKRASATRTKG